tara:strand:- start:1992 stop:3539 length:1548 start_codon:yes stop_codon:yes gene_type:complete
MNIKYLPFIVGLAMLTVLLGAATWYVSQHFSAAVIALLLLGGSLLLLGAICRSQHSTLHQRAPVWGKRLVIIIMVLGTVILWSGTNYLANSHSARWDVTAHQLHTLSPATIEYIGALEQPVQLTSFYVGQPPQYLRDVLKEYERISAGLISTEIVDPIADIGYAAKFGNLVSGSERKVIVQSAGERKDVDFSEAALSEIDLTHAIASVTRAPTQACFLVGHSEYSLLNEDNSGLSIYAQLLATNNIRTQELMLGVGQVVPEDCDLVVVAAAANDLTAQESAAINTYLDAGGDALFFIEQTTAKSHNSALNAILNHWGLAIQADIVVDFNSHVGGDIGSPATKNYGHHKAITEGLDYTFYVHPRSIRILDQRRTSIKYAPIVSTASAVNSWAEANVSVEPVFDKGVDTPGPVPIAYVLLEEKTAKETSDTRIIVFTDIDFLTNIYIEQYSNAQMGLNITNWLAATDAPVYLNEKNIQVDRLDLTSIERRQVLAILVCMPLFFAIAGIMVWLRLRRY